MIQDAIYARLSGDPEYAARVGERTFPVRRGTPTLGTSIARPYVVYFLVSEPEEYTLDGRAGVANSRYQFDIWADSYEDGNALKLIMARLLGDWRERNAEGSGTDVLQTRKLNAFEGFDEESEPQLYRVTSDYSIQHSAD